MSEPLSRTVVDRGQQYVPCPLDQAGSKEDEQDDEDDAHEYETKKSSYHVALSPPQGFVVYPEYPYCMVVSTRKASSMEDEKDAIRVNYKALPIWMNRLISQQGAGRMENGEEQPVVLSGKEDRHMERQMMWSPWTGPGLEHLHLHQQQEGIVADGLILGVKEQTPFRLRYEIHCDLHWRLRAVHLSVPAGSSRSLYLFTDGGGSWTMESGKALPLLKGCLDVDISATPFTNTLPIRRLALQPGSSVTLNMAYLEVPQLRLEVAEQRYTCLEVTTSGGRYRFESLVNGVTNFTAELPVDADGLVVDYPELFRRVGMW